MTIAVQYGLKVYQMYAITAFLQGDIVEDIYVVQPEEFNEGSGKQYTNWKMLCTGLSKPEEECGA